MLYGVLEIINNVGVTVVVEVMLYGVLDNINTVEVTVVVLASRCGVENGLCVLDAVEGAIVVTVVSFIGRRFR
jgi:hypothetical protein